MNKKYIVRLIGEERKALKDLVKKGMTQAYRIKHANVLLAVDADGANWSDEQTAQAYSCSLSTVHNIRRCFVEGGFTSALERKKQEKPSRERILDGEKEARLISLACSKPPSGHARWTLELLADQLVQLQVVRSISSHTVGRTLKKTNLNLISGSVG